MFTLNKLLIKELDLKIIEVDHKQGDNGDYYRLLAYLQDSGF